ncbi:hypothetical protein BDV40DRAFT_147472 [Aspergillus tamarii]|uniref:Uncharacterized protein n=1 Tax=Aspergillus tamarii TaxID=41984 RepID=A0A5N6UWQ4_ASPTM|nr:hypothetical protein BDV40DRAFT_147472 [Aspergillus tamarii]
MSAYPVWNTLLICFVSVRVFLQGKVFFYFFFPVLSSVSLFIPISVSVLFFLCCCLLCSFPTLPLPGTPEERLFDVRKAVYTGKGDKMER